MLRPHATLVTAATLLSLALFGCSADEGTADNTDEGGRCVDVSMKMLKTIASDNGIKPLSGAAVLSKDFDQVYMIAMEFQGAGYTDKGVWASGSLTPGGSSIMSVDALAQEVTQWPNGTVDSPLDISVEGAQEALDCLG